MRYALVAHKRTDDGTVKQLLPARWSAEWWLYRLALEFEIRTGIQSFAFSHFRVWRRNKDGWDILHLHNLHGDYFDLGALLQVGEKVPTVQTLHDCWQFTGHCAHPGNCERWKSGCGQCPHLAAIPQFAGTVPRSTGDAKSAFMENSFLR